MKKINTVSIALLVLFSVSWAKFPSDYYIWTFAMGPSLMAEKESNKSITTYNASIAMEKSFENVPISIGGYWSYIRGELEQGNDKFNFKSYRTIPVLFETKWVAERETSHPYLGLGVGLQFSQIEYYIERNRFVDHDTGFAVSANTGLHFPFNDSIAFHAGYRVLWLHNLTYRNAFSHSISLGLSFLVE